jgi:TolB-like protein/Tfp pilus assembly protein PilF
MSIARQPASPAHPYPSHSFFGRLKSRGIIGAFATIVGSGWLAYEIVHFILVDHYHLPERLKDVTIISTLCTLLCTIAWRWFRGEKRKRKIKWEYVLLPAFILAGTLLNGNYLLHPGGDDAGHDSPAIQATAWINSVAVLPFVNMSGDPDQEYFCDGLTEELITKLSQIQELKVPARTSAFIFKDKRVDIHEVGQRLRVDNVLEGSVRKSGPHVRITAQLINVADGYHLWSESYDRNLDDVFSVQDEIARSVAGTLQVRLLGEKRTAPETRNGEAYNAVLMARYFYGQPTRENLAKAVGYYEQAVKLDPGFARAWAGLGATYAFQAGNGYISPEEGYDLAKTAVKKALALDKDLAYAHRIFGWIKMSCDWDWAAADASYRKAMSLAPGSVQLEAAQLAVAMGRFEAATALARRAVELDPMSSPASTTLGLALWYGGRLEEALATYRRILELNPEYPTIHGLIGLVYLTQSKPQEALADLDQAEDPFWRLPGLAIAYHSLGRKAESDAALTEFIEKYQAGGAYNVAQVYACRGDYDRAFQWLERAYAQRDGGMFLVKVDPLLKNLRADARFKALLKRLHLPV